MEVRHAIEGPSIKQTGLRSQKLILCRYRQHAKVGRIPGEVRTTGAVHLPWLLPTRYSTQDWTCLFSDEFSTEGMELQFSQYQYQRTPVPSTDKVCSALRYRNVDPLGRRHEYTGGFRHEVSATDT